VHVLDVKPVKSAPSSAAASFPPLPSMRLAEPFELLRDASDALLVRTGARPRIFLANLGTPAQFTARATFAKNFFEAGGIEAVTSDGFESRDAMVAAFKASGAALACLCSTDEIYAKQAVDAARALAAAGARQIYLAGRPRDRDALQAAGVESFIFAGCDALAVLRGAHSRIAS
jgi:methylmalonyl-CoA mutase